MPDWAVRIGIVSLLVLYHLHLLFMFWDRILPCCPDWPEFLVSTDLPCLSLLSAVTTGVGHHCCLREAPVPPLVSVTGHSNTELREVVAHQALPFPLPNLFSLYSTSKPCRLFTKPWGPPGLCPCSLLWLMNEPPLPGLSWLVLFICFFPSQLPYNRKVISTMFQKKKKKKTGPQISVRLLDFFLFLCGAYITHQGAFVRARTVARFVPVISLATETHVDKLFFFPLDHIRKEVCKSMVFLIPTLALK